ncbi:MAG: 1-acyl-sn-glycerol-3-phosphate acyltransferase [Chitinophagales bacterium]|nr:1-acyl-sn-glycerol-3-phosphate acyltransferase [Chitinophagales bacterium]
MKILRLLYSIYAVIIIFLLFIPAIPIYVIIKVFVSYPQQQYWVHKVNRIIFLVWSSLVAIRYDIKGVENIDFHQNYIAICNHSNLGDLLASAYGIQVPSKPLVKKELLKVPIFGQLFAMASVPVDRKDHDARKKSMERMESELNQKISLIIFPEGTRNKTNNPLKEFYNGAFQLSLNTGVPILPVIFTNMRGFSDTNSLLIQPWKIEVIHLTPIYPQGYSNVEEYKDAVFKMMWNSLVDNSDLYKSFEKL